MKQENARREEIANYTFTVTVIDGFTDEVIHNNEVLTVLEIGRWFDDSNYVHFTSDKAREYFFNLVKRI